MHYTKDFTLDDIEEGCTIRDEIDNEIQTVGQYKKGEGWHVYPENIKSDLGFYVPDNRWPGRYELLIND